MSAKRPNLSLREKIQIYFFKDKTERRIFIVFHAIGKYLNTKHRIRLNESFKLHVITLNFTIINFVAEIKIKIYFLTLYQNMQNLCIHEKRIWQWLSTKLCGNVSSLICLRIWSKISKILSWCQISNFPVVTILKISSYTNEDRKFAHVVK